MRALRRLLRESLYVVDELAVANAIVMRATVRGSIPDSGFRSELRAPEVRSFRPAPGAGSFRLLPTGRRSAHV